MQLALATSAAGADPFAVTLLQRQSEHALPPKSHLQRMIHRGTRRRTGVLRGRIVEDLR